MAEQSAKKYPRIGVGVLIFRDEELLIGRRKGSQGSGTYALPGGHLEYLEELEACAVRETLEETGLSVINPRLEWVENSFFGQPDDLQHYVTIFMRADLQNRTSEAQVLEPDKCEGWEWVKWPSIPQPVFKPLQQLLDGPYQPKDLPGLQQNKEKLHGN